MLPDCHADNRPVCLNFLTHMWHCEVKSDKDHQKRSLNHLMYKMTPIGEKHSRGKPYKYNIFFTYSKAHTYIT